MLESSSAFDHYREQITDLLLVIPAKAGIQFCL
jgi:hypothetical protein